MSLDPILAGAWELEEFCRARGWRFCFIGGIAVQRWGEYWLWRRREFH